MPRRSISDRLNLNQDLFIHDLETNTSKLVSDHLKNNYFDLLVKTKEPTEKIECPICFEDLLCCKRCFGLLSCGHYMHTTCYMKIIDSKCPCCRG